MDGNNMRRRGRRVCKRWWMRRKRIKARESKLWTVFPSGKKKNCTKMYLRYISFLLSIL